MFRIVRDWDFVCVSGRSEGESADPLPDNDFELDMPLSVLIVLF